MTIIIHRLSKWYLCYWTRLCPKPHWKHTAPTYTYLFPNDLLVIFPLSRLIHSLACGQLNRIFIKVSTLNPSEPIQLCSIMQQNKSRQCFHLVCQLFLFLLEWHMGVYSPRLGSNLLLSIDAVPGNTFPHYPTLPGFPTSPCVCVSVCLCWPALCTLICLPVTIHLGILSVLSLCVCVYVCEFTVCVCLLYVCVCVSVCEGFVSVCVWGFWVCMK